MQNAQLISEYNCSLVILHFTVFIWGFTAILGKLISSQALTLVWHRMTITFFVYLLLPTARAQLKLTDRATIATYFGVGLIVCGHWVSWYASIKYGNSASISVACLGVVSFFSSILEPCLLNKKFSVIDFASGLVVVAGVLCIYASLPAPPASANYDMAIGCGVLSAGLGSLFNVLNKKYHKLAPPLVMATVEMGAGALMLTILVVSLDREKTQWFPSFNINDVIAFDTSTFQDGSWDLIWILILAVVCTNVTFYLSSFVLKDLSAFTVNLACNLEPVYGIILGALCFQENQALNKEFYFGAMVILAAVFANVVIGQICGTTSTDSLQTDVKSAYSKSETASNCEYEMVLASDVDADEEFGLQRE